MIQRTRIFYLHIYTHIQNEYVYTNGRFAFQTCALKHLIDPFQGQQLFRTLDK